MRVVGLLQRGPASLGGPSATYRPYTVGRPGALLRLPTGPGVAVVLAVSVAGGSTDHLVLPVAGGHALPDISTHLVGVLAAECPTTHTPLTVTA